MHTYIIVSYLSVAPNFSPEKGVQFVFVYMYECACTVCTYMHTYIEPTNTFSVHKYIYAYIHTYIHT
jgi:hypothetical protein